MQNLIAIALGGSMGALARFHTANAIYAWLGRDFPHGTLFVNVSGSFLMGFLTQLLLLRFPEATACRAAVLVGFLGAYTTFSTFSIETFTLMDDGHYLKAASYAVLSVVLCVVATWTGLVTGRRLFSLEWQAWFADDSAWIRVAGVVVLGFVLGLATEWVFLRYGWVTSARPHTLIVLLTLLTVLGLSQTLPALSGSHPAHHALPTAFAASALASALSLWAGMAVARG